MNRIERDRLRTHLEHITGERFPDVSNKHLQSVITYLQTTLRNAGYDLERHPFQVDGMTYENIIARKEGFRKKDRIIVGAHFDSVMGSPGADDNASGVASMLELARRLKDRKWNHTIEFVGFHLEEWNMLGSVAYVKKLKREGIKVRGMFSLEMIGFTSHQPKSQQMPPGFSFFYPDVGNFIGLVGNLSSIPLLNIFKRHMKKINNLPVETLVMPLNGALVPATRLSDHSPFWDAGYPALLITDTSFFRNPHYHGPTDTIETLDLDFMTRVTEGVERALLALDEVS